jgi:hypothetical protein
LVPDWFTTMMPAAVQASTSIMSYPAPVELAAGLVPAVRRGTVPIQMAGTSPDMAIEACP